MKKSIILFAVMAFGLAGERIEATNFGKAVGDLPDVVKTITDLKASISTVAKDLIAESKKFKDTSLSGNERARSAVKVLNNGIIPLENLIKMMSAVSKLLIDAELATSKMDASASIREKVVPRLIQVQSAIDQLKGIATLLLLTIPEAAAVEVAGAPKEEELVFE